MALSEYEKTVMDSIVQQKGTEQDFREWLSQRREQAPVETVETTEKVTVSPEGAGVTEEVIVKEDPGLKEAAISAIKPLGTALGELKEGAVSTVKGIGGEAKEVVTGLTNIIERDALKAANAIRKILGKPEISTEEAIKIKEDAGGLAGGLESTIQEDLLDVGEGGLGLGLTAAFPGTTALLNTAAQDPVGQAALIPLAEGMKTGGEVVNKIPVLKQFRESLPEDRRDDFDSFTAQVVALGLAKSTSEILSKYRATKATKLTKQSEALVNEFIKPTKETSKAITKKITPEILERKIKGTREQVGEIAEAGVKESGKAIETFIKEGKVKGDIEIGKLVDVLAKEEAKLMFEGKILPGKEPQIKFIENTLDFLEQVQSKTGNKLNATQKIQLKRSFDTVFDKAITRDKITKFQDDLQVKLADTLRNELAKNNPDFAKLNQEFAFFKGLETVMKETNLRTTGQAPVGLGETILGGQRGAVGAGVGAAAGGSVAGPIGAGAGALLGSVIGGKLQKIVSNPKYKLLSANKKANLAKTLSEGNTPKITTLLNSFGVTMGLDFKD